MKSRKIAGIGMMVALAFVLSYVEAMIPVNIGIPGIKLGLSNIVVIFCMYTYSPIVTFGIAVVRIILCGLTFGSMASLMYSLAGGMLSFAVMLLLKKIDIFSVQGVSVAGGVSHNIGQIIVAMVILQTKLLVYYLPFLLIAGVVAGVLVGVLGGILVSRRDIIQ